MTIPINFNSEIIKGHILLIGLALLKSKNLSLLNKKMMVFDDSENWDKKIMIINKPIIKQNNSLVLNTKN